MRKALMALGLTAILQGVAAAELPLPAVPDTLRTLQERAAYITLHFWDALYAPTETADSTDGIGAYPREAVEQAFANFASVLPIATAEQQQTAVDTLMNMLASRRDDYRLMADIAEKYLYNTDSPMLSEELYILFLRHIVGCDVLNKTEKLRPQWQLEGALKNRPGHRAADFKFTDRQGMPTTLYETIDNTADNRANIVLIFYDPDCDHCTEAIEQITGDNSINASLSAGETMVVAIYSGDDRSLWDRTAQALPQAWIVGYDDVTLQDDEIYIIRSLPSIYLINKEKNVVAKNLTPDTLREALSR